MPPKPVATRIRIMNWSDIASGEHLNTIAGWNQTEADWRRFLDSSPNGCFVTEVDGRIVGTAVTISYENRFAWIGMVLVDPEFRNMGIGTRLLHRAMEHLDRIGVSTMKLDATPVGMPIYSKLGFVSEYEIERWLLNRPVTGAPWPSAVTSNVDETQLAAIFPLDREVFGADRSFLLRSLHELAPDLTSVVWSDGIPQGYAFGRKGRFADHLCPCVALVERTARQLLQHFLRRSSRDSLIVDCLPANSAMVDALREAGFVFSRPLTRMVRGPNTYPGRPGVVGAILGPEFG